MLAHALLLVGAKQGLNLTTTRPLPHETSTTVATRVAYWRASMIGSRAVT